MQLRTTHRLPGRYREDHVPELPPTPKFVTPDVKYNPNLRAAAFPTLSLDKFPPVDVEETRRPRVMSRTGKSDVDTNSGGLMENRNRNGSANGARSASQRKATVFRDNRVSLPVVRQLVKAPDYKGMYDSYASLDPEGSEKDEERSVLKRLVQWDDMSDGIKLVLMREMCQEMPFQRACEIFTLQKDEITNFMGIYAQELDRNKMEEENIARAAEEQVALLMSGTYSSVVKDYTKISEELYDSVQTPATFLITAEDVLRAKLFLVNFKFDDDDTFAFDPNNDVLTIIKDDEAWGVQANIINRMSSYEGVQASWYDVAFSVLDREMPAAREEGESTEEGGDTDEMEDTIDVVRPSQSSRPVGRPRKSPIEGDTPHGKSSQSRKPPIDENATYGVPSKKRSGKRLTLQDEEDIKAGRRNPPRAWKGSLTRPAHLMPKTKIPPGRPGPSRLRQSITASDLDASSGTDSPMASSSQPPSRPTPRPNYLTLNSDQGAPYAPRIFSGGKPYPGPPRRQSYVNATVAPQSQQSGLRNVETPEPRRSGGYEPVRDIDISPETTRMNHLPGPHDPRSVQTLQSATISPAKPSNHPPVDTSRHLRRSQSSTSVSSARNSALQPISTSSQQTGGPTGNMRLLPVQHAPFPPNNTSHSPSVTVPQKRKAVNAPSSPEDNSISYSPPNHSDTVTAAQVPNPKRKYVKRDQSSAMTSVPSQSATGPASSQTSQNALADTRTFPNAAQAQYSPQNTSRAGTPNLVPPANRYPLMNTSTPQAISQTENIPDRHPNPYNYRQSLGNASQINELQPYEMSRASASPMSQGLYQPGQNLVNAPPRSISLGSGQLASQPPQNFANAPPRSISLGSGQPAAPIVTPAFALSENSRIYPNNIYPRPESSPRSHQQSHPLQSEDTPTHVGINTPNNSIQDIFGVQQQTSGGHIKAPQSVQGANEDASFQGTISQNLNSLMQTGTPIPQSRTALPQPMTIAQVAPGDSAPLNEALSFSNATANSVHLNKSNESNNLVLQTPTPTRQSSSVTEQPFNIVPEIKTPVSKYSSRNGKTPILPPSLSSSPAVVRDPATPTPAQKSVGEVNAPQPASNHKPAVRLKLTNSKSSVSRSSRSEKTAPELAASLPMSRRSSSRRSVTSNMRPEQTTSASMGRRSSSRRSGVSNTADEPLSAVLEQTTSQSMSRRSSSRRSEDSKTSDGPLKARRRISAGGKVGTSQNVDVPSTPKAGNRKNVAGASSRAATEGESADMSKKMGAPPELFEEKTRSAAKASRKSGGNESLSSSGGNPKEEVASNVEVVVPDMNPKRRASNQPDAPAPAAKKPRTRATGATAASQRKTVEKKPAAEAAPAAKPAPARRAPAKTALAKGKEEVKAPAKAKPARSTGGRKK